MQTKSSFLKSAGPLLLVLFIDGMGLGLVIPILNGLIFNADSTFLSGGELSPLMHNVIYGSIISIFMLCWFFGAAFLGDLSDNIGRKKSLIICLAGAFLSYLISAFAVSLHSLALLIIGRVIGGFTSGSQPIAQAAIVDLSTPQDKARNIGYILLSLSLGFIVGPLLGGILADNRLVSWFDFATPFYFAALVSFINLALLLALFKETFVTKNTTYRVNPYQAVHIFISAFRNAKVRNLSIIYCIFILGWSSFYSFISIYLLQVYDFSPTKVSLFMAAMGVGFGLGNGFLVNFFARFFTLQTNFVASCLLSSAIIFLMVIVHQSLFNWLMIVPIASCVSIAYASILTLFSDQVDTDSQGWVMGITGSIMAFVFAVDGVVIGVVAAFSAHLPIIIAASGLLASVALTYFLFVPRQQTYAHNELQK